MGYGNSTGSLIAVPPIPTPSLEPALDVAQLNRGDRVNVAGIIRTVDRVAHRSSGLTLVVWQGATWTEAPGPYNTASFLEAVGAYREEAA